ncbi:hypothetical protein MRB53_006608 [Persea americana]|uniref:Uncharacterized protein n=1 Tax=Persea americana TaxID=3435 RepID=A0ACC2MGN8_PERAE|nr:hypothetical protein MRB53_006608 [Persea americana]
MDPGKSKLVYKMYPVLGMHRRSVERCMVGGMKPKVSMIITDYCMPEMTGFDLLKRVKESSTLREIPVVVMSSENIPTRISRCLEEGAEEFLLKPLRPSDVSRLRSHMNPLGSVS